MSMSQEKITLLDQYLNGFTDENNKSISPGYTDENRYNFCTLALRKYRFEKYSMIKKEEIAPEDFIVNDVKVRHLIQSVVDKEECSVEDFKKVFDALTVDQINYIGY
tara:strand:- start:208 stop:528 length:321 start_codon:yes stop_codon:yes gene_type:complete